MYTDPDGEFIFTALCLFVPGLQPFLPLGIAADVGMYAGGAIQQGNANPLKWDYSDGDLYKSMTVGAIAGAGAMAGLGYLSGAAYTGAAGWGMISNSLLYANANMLSSVIGDYKNTGEFSLDNTFNAGISGLLYGGLGAGEPMKLWELVVANNVNDNLDILNGEAARLHIGPIGYDFGRNTNGFYSIFDKGSEGQRFDMLMETVWGLSLVPDFEVGYDGYVKKPTLNNMRDCYGRFKSPSEWTYRAKKWFDVSYSIPYGGQSSMQGFRDWLKYFYDIYKYN